jgi:hypothetical protein
MYAGIGENGPDAGIVSLHAVEARFDSSISMEDDILSIKIQVCIPPRGLSKTDGMASFLRYGALSRRGTLLYAIRNHRRRANWAVSTAASSKALGLPLHHPPELGRRDAVSEYPSFVPYESSRLSEYR